MRLFEINETDDLMQLVPKILQECSFIRNFYAQYPNLRLFRGMNADGKYSLKIQNRTDRVPKDNTYFIQKLTNDFFDKNGFSFNRSNCLFTSSELDDTEVYGDGYLLFPVNGFKIIWSPNVNDLWWNVFDPQSDDKIIATDYKGELPLDTPREEFADEFKDLFERFDTVAEWYVNTFLPWCNYTEGDFLNAMKSQHEIMFNGAAYAIRYDYFKSFNMIKFREALGVT